MDVIKLRDEHIKLGQALKAAGLADSGVDAKHAIADGLVKVNGRILGEGVSFTPATLSLLTGKK